MVKIHIDSNVSLGYVSLELGEEHVAWIELISSEAIEKKAKVEMEWMMSIVKEVVKKLD